MSTFPLSAFLAESVYFVRKKNPVHILGMGFGAGAESNFVG